MSELLKSNFMVEGRVINSSNPVNRNRSWEVDPGTKPMIKYKRKKLNLGMFEVWQRSQYMIIKYAGQTIQLRRDEIDTVIDLISKIKDEVQ